jgi:hypothetical protein
METGINPIIAATTVLEDNGITTVFIITFINGGFVIIPGNNSLKPIMVYSVEYGFQLDSENLVFNEWLDFIEDQVIYVDTNQTDNSQTLPYWVDILSESWLLYNTNREVLIGSLLTTQWGQGEYYNELCPVDNSIYILL